jgi:hypothetical protein
MPTNLAPSTMPRTKAAPQRRTDAGTVFLVDRDVAAQERQALYNDTKAQIPALVRDAMPQMMSIVGTDVPSPRRSPSPTRPASPRRRSPSPKRTSKPKGLKVGKGVRIKSIESMRKKKKSKSPKCPVGCVPAPKATKGQQKEGRMLRELERKAAAYDRMYTDVGELSELMATPAKKQRSPARSKSPKKQRSPARKKSPCTVHKSNPSGCNAAPGCHYVHGAKQQYCRKTSPPKTYPMASITPALPTAMAMYGPAALGAPVATANPLTVAMARPMPRRR